MFTFQMLKKDNEWTQWLSDHPENARVWAGWGPGSSSVDVARLWLGRGAARWGVGPESGCGEQWAPFTPLLSSLCRNGPAHEKGPSAGERSPSEASHHFRQLLQPTARGAQPLCKELRPGLRALGVNGIGIAGLWREASSVRQRNYMRKGEFKKNRAKSSIRRKL